MNVTRRPLRWRPKLPDSLAPSASPAASPRRSATDDGGQARRTHANAALEHLGRTVRGGTESYAVSDRR